jgi:hypothetical protein
MLVPKTRAAAGGAALGLLLGLALAPAAQAAPRPGVPETLRLSSGPYAGFEFCGAAPTASTSGPALAASPTAPGGGYTPPGTPYPTVGATFELARPGTAAFLRQDVRPFNGFTLVYEVPAGTLADGAYRWRVRAVDRGVASAWSQWCNFTVRTGDS